MSKFRPSEGERVAVLGAGPMGLAAAYQLSLEGYQPVVFEADARIGGMAASFDFNGLTIERYYHFHCTSDHDLLSLLEELHLADKLHWVRTKMGFYFLGRVQPWGDPLSLLLFEGLSFLDKLRYGMHVFTCTRRKKPGSLDDLRATEWIKWWVGPRAFDVLWRKLFELKFYELADNVSAAWIWSRIRRVGRSRYNMFAEKLAYIDGGSEVLLNAMRDVIVERGGEIRLSCPASRVFIDDDSVVGIEASAEFHDFRTVICTVPLPYVPELIPDLPHEILKRYRSVQYVAVVCVIVKLKHRITENFWLNINDEAINTPGLIEYTNLRPMKHHIIYVPFYMPEWHAEYGDSDAVFEQKVRAYLRRIKPELSESDILDVRVSRYRKAQPVCPPGFSGHLPPVKLPVRGLFVADTSFYYPEDRGISESVGLARRIARMVAASP